MTEEKQVEAVTEWPKRDHGMTWEAWVVLTLGQVKREVDALKVGAAPQVILDSDANEAIVEELRKENAELRARCQAWDDIARSAAADEKELREQLAQLAEAGTGYSQQTMDALVRERNDLQAENAALSEQRQMWDAAMRAATEDVKELRAQLDAQAARRERAEAGWRRCAAVVRWAKRATISTKAWTWQLGESREVLEPLAPGDAEGPTP